MFNEGVRVQWTLDDHTSLDNLTHHILNLPYLTGTTDLGRLLAQEIRPFLLLCLSYTMYIVIIRTLSARQPGQRHKVTSRQINILEKSDKYF